MCKRTRYGKELSIRGPDDVLSVRSLERIGEDLWSNSVETAFRAAFAENTS